MKLVNKTTDITPDLALAAKALTKDTEAANPGLGAYMKPLSFDQRGALEVCYRSLKL